MRATECCDNTCEGCIANEERIEQVKRDLAGMLKVARVELKTYYERPPGKRADSPLFALAVARLGCYRDIAHSIEEPALTFEQVEREVIAEIESTRQADEPERADG